MLSIRRNTFETNSSSTHSLNFEENNNYLPIIGNIITIKFIDTDTDFIYASLSEKVSYLVGHIIDNYKYNCETYLELKDAVEEDWRYKDIENYIKNTFNISIRLPKNYSSKKDLENIVYINHQLTESYFEDVLDDLLSTYNISTSGLTFVDKLAKILDKDYYICIGRD